MYSCDEITQTRKRWSFKIALKADGPFLVREMRDTTAVLKIGIISKWYHSIKSPQPPHPRVTQGVPTIIRQRTVADYVPLTAARPQNQTAHGPHQKQSADVQVSNREMESDIHLSLLDAVTPANQSDPTSVIRRLTSATISSKELIQVPEGPDADASQLITFDN